MPVNLGVSELPGRTFGKMQVMTNVQAGLNLRAAVFELERDYGEIVTYNESDRSRPDQRQLRAEYEAYKAGTGPWAPLAAYCADPPGTYTSTHDPINYGNAADLGGPGGAVISARARNLLDGNHPDGVLGRKYGLYNTGWNFATREIWHFNSYPARAQVQAEASDSTTPITPPAPTTPRRDNEMSFILQAPPAKGAAKASMLIEPGRATQLNSERFQFWSGLKDGNGQVLYPIVQGNERQYALAIEHRDVIK